MDQHQRSVAFGTWLYDGTVPRRVTIIATPADYADSRYEPHPYDDELIGPVRPAPQTEDGFVYYILVCGRVGSEFHSLAEAKAAADSQPWGPVAWDAGGSAEPLNP